MMSEGFLLVLSPSKRAPSTLGRSQNSRYEQVGSLQIKKLKNNFLKGKWRQDPSERASELRRREMEILHSIINESVKMHVITHH
jgi:hypothetical protein